MSSRTAFATGPGTHRRLSLLATVAACAVLFGACSGGSEEATLTGVVREPPLSVGSVYLTSAGGEEVAMKAPEGGLLVTTFGYTNCPDICPTTLSDLSVAVNDLPDDLARRVSVAFVTVDPARDTPQVLTDYVGSFFPEQGTGFHGSDDDQLANATDAFGVQFTIAEHDPGATDYEVSHTAGSFVVDDTGTVVVEWPFGATPEDMAADLTTLLTESASG